MDSPASPAGPSLLPRWGAGTLLVPAPRLLSAGLALRVPAPSSSLPAAEPAPGSAPCRLPVPAGTPAFPLLVLAPPQGGWDFALGPRNLALVASSVPSPALLLPASWGVVALGRPSPAVAILLLCLGPGVVPAEVSAGRAVVLPA